MGIHFPICLVYYLQILYKVKKFTRLNFYFVSLFVFSSSLCLVRFCQLLRYTDNRIVNIMKVYIKRNNLQVELIRYSYLCEATDSMQYRPPNVNEFSKHVGSVSDSLGQKHVVIIVD